MGKITYRTPGDDVEHEVDFADGDSVMAAAVNNDIPGIEGECGGELNCGTCHVYVTDRWRDAFPEADFDEEGMLDIVDDRTQDSRLGCQLRLGAQHDGLTVTVATGMA